MPVTEKKIIEEDVRGQICPSCLLLALRHVNDNKDRIKSGEADFHILTDNRHSTATIPNAVINMGYSVGVVKEEGFYRIIISQQTAKEA